MDDLRTEAHTPTPEDPKRLIDFARLMYEDVLNLSPGVAIEDKETLLTKFDLDLQLKRLKADERIKTLENVIELLSPSTELSLGNTYQPDYELSTAPQITAAISPPNSEINTKTALPSSNIFLDSGYVYRSKRWGGRLLRRGISPPKNLRQASRTKSEEGKPTKIIITFNKVINPSESRFRIVTEEITNTHKLVNAEINTHDIHAAATQEECLHAAEELMRGMATNQRYSRDQAIYDADKTIVHASVVVDQILTAAAAEIGPQELLYWQERAQQQRQQDKDNFSELSEYFHQTLLGKHINERFQYQPLSKTDLIGYILSLQDDINTTWFDLTYPLLPNERVKTVTELGMLSFGRTYQNIFPRLALDIGHERATGTPIDYDQLYDELIDKGKRVLEFYKGKPEEAELVRHHNPWNGDVDSAVQALSYTHADEKTLREKIAESIAEKRPIVLEVGTLITLSEANKLQKK